MRKAWRRALSAKCLVLKRGVSCGVSSIQRLRRLKRLVFQEIGDRDPAQPFCSRCVSGCDDLGHLFGYLLADRTTPCPGRWATKVCAAADRPQYLIQFDVRSRHDQPRAA